MGLLLLPLLLPRRPDLAPDGRLLHPLVDSRLLRHLQDHLRRVHLRRWLLRLLLRHPGPLLLPLLHALPRLVPLQVGARRVRAHAHQVHPPRALRPPRLLLPGVCGGGKCCALQRGRAAARAQAAVASLPPPCHLLHPAPTLPHPAPACRRPPWATCSSLSPRTRTPWTRRCPMPSTTLVSTPSSCSPPPSPSPSREPLPACPGGLPPLPPPPPPHLRPASSHPHPLSALLPAPQHPALLRVGWRPLLCLRPHADPVPACRHPPQEAAHGHQRRPGHPCV